MSELKPRRMGREKLLSCVYWMAAVDPEVMAEAPLIDRSFYQAKFALLMAVVGVALFSWSGFLFLFFPWFIALPMLVPIIVWLALLDRFMGSQWKQHGILRAPKMRHAALSWVAILGLIASNAPLGLRLGVALVTSSATAVSATMAMSHATIAAQEEKDRNEANAALRAQGEAEKRQTWRDMLGAEDAAVNQAAAELNALKRQIEAARNNRESAAGVVTGNQVNADCELHGGPGSGCKRGRGPKYRAALIHSAAANAAMARSAADLAALEAQLPAAESKYQDALKALHAREPDYLKAAQAIDARVARDEVKSRNDPVMAWRALQKIYQSPDGEATRFYAHLMLTLLLTIELSYVLVSEYFGQASVYMARLMGRTRTLAAKAAADCRRETAALFGGDNSAPRLSWRVLPRFGADD